MLYIFKDLEVENRLGLPCDWCGQKFWRGGCIEPGEGVDPRSIHICSNCCKLHKRTRIRNFFKDTGAIRIINSRKIQFE